MIFFLRSEWYCFRDRETTTETTTTIFNRDGCPTGKGCLLMFPSTTQKHRRFHLPPSIALNVCPNRFVVSVKQCKNSTWRFPKLDYCSYLQFPIITIHLPKLIFVSVLPSTMGKVTPMKVVLSCK